MSLARELQLRSSQRLRESAEAARARARRETPARLHRFALRAALLAVETAGKRIAAARADLEMLGTANHQLR